MTAVNDTFNLMFFGSTYRSCLLTIGGTLTSQNFLDAAAHFTIKRPFEIESKVS
jgi:hypothetical protein